MGGRVTYALGYTGLGVGASRWAGGVVRDFILRPDEDRLVGCGSCRARRSPSRPSRCARWPSTWSGATSTGPTATRGGGRLLLRTLDALGIGFDS